MHAFLLMFVSLAVMVIGSVGAGSSLAASPGSWESVLAKAKEEGSVIVYGPGNEGLRRAMTKPFEDRYGVEIPIEFRTILGISPFTTRFLP